jgi:hypothetical protein
VASTLFLGWRSFYSLAVVHTISLISHTTPLFLRWLLIVRWSRARSLRNWCLDDCPFLNLSSWRLYGLTIIRNTSQFTHFLPPDSLAVLLETGGFGDGGGGGTFIVEPF